MLTKNHQEAYTHLPDTFDISEATEGALETSLGVIAIGLGLMIAFLADLPLPL